MSQENKKAYSLIEEYLNPTGEKPAVSRLFYLSKRVNDPSIIKVTQQGKFNGVALYYPNSYSLKAEATVYDDAKRQQRIIRYVLGEQSIFKDEQTKETEIPLKIQQVEFSKGSINVRKEEVNLMKFLMLHPANGSNPFRDKTVDPIFFENKPDQNADAALDNDKILMEAKNYCHNEPWEGLRLHARVLGIDLNQTPKEIRYEMLVKFAQRDPAKFLAGIKDPTNKRISIIRQAIEEKILEFNERENTIKWPGGNAIATAPIGINPVNHLANLTFVDNRGEELFEHISLLVSGETSTELKSEASAPEYAIKSDAMDDYSLFKEAVTAGVLEDKNSWVYFKRGTPEERKWNGKKEVLKDLRKTPEVKAFIIDQINKAKIAIS